MVHYRNPANQQVYGYDPVTQQGLIDQAISNGWTLLPVWPLPPTEEELKAECKNIAAGLLSKTDWTVVPDVANSANSPHLANQADFIAYRNVIRGYAVNPVANPVWPEPPVPVWA